MCSASVLAALEHRVARVGVEAGGDEERSGGAAGDERVAAGQAADLSERVKGEGARAIEPQLVLRSLECGEQPEAVARRAVTDSVAFLRSGRPCSPDELGAGEQELLVEVVARGGDDARRARAPLELALTAPVGEPVLMRRGAREGGCGVGAQRLVAWVVDLQQRATVAGEPVDGADPAEARVPKPLRPEAVRVAARRARLGPLAGPAVPG